jgi:hypothetical protein
MLAKTIDIEKMQSTKSAIEQIWYRNNASNKKWLATNINIQKCKQATFQKVLATNVDTKKMQATKIEIDKSASNKVCC